MTLNPVTVTARYLTSDEKRPITEGRLAFTPPVILPQLYEIKDVTPRWNNDGVVSFTLYSDVTDLVYTYREELAGGKRTLSLTIPANSTGTLFLGDLAGWSAPTGVAFVHEPLLNPADDPSLKAAYASNTLSNRIVLFGNSRIDREKYVSGTTYQASSLGLFNWANARVGSRFTVVASTGVSGNLLSDMIARWSTDVAAYSPAWVLLADAVNDASNNRTTAQMIADTQTLIGLAKGIGARVILLTAPPNNGHTTAQRNALNAWNDWVKASADRSVVPVDVASAVTDPSTGGYAAAYTAEGLHQNQAGAARMGRVLAPVLANLLPPRDWFPSSPTDPANPVVNPWSGGTPGAGSFPSPWNFSGTATIATVARTDLVPGNWLQVTTASATSVFVKQTFNLPAGIAIGDSVRLLVELQVDSAGLTGAQFLDTSIQALSAGSATLATGGSMAGGLVGTYPAGDLPLSPDTLVLESLPLVIPASTTQLLVQGHVFGQGTVRYGRFAVLKV